MRKQTRESFLSKVLPVANGCHEWQGSILSSGYGQVKWHGKNVLAHRLSAYFHGLLPTIEKSTAGAQYQLICHKCDNKKCCNPEHLYLGSGADNRADAIARNRIGGVAGSLHHAARLTEVKVVKIRELADSGVVVADLARKFLASPRNIRKILSGARWKHV
jgi:hypothetical protein